MTALTALLLVHAFPVPAATPGPQPDPAAAFATALQEEKDLNRWKGSISAGGSISTGNTERTSGNASVDMEYRREDDRTTVFFDWSYAQEEDPNTGVDNTTERRTGGGAQYDYFLSEKSYALASAFAESDLLAGVELRQVYGVGYGYQFKETEDWKLAAEIGAAYYDEAFYDGGGSEYIAGRFGYNWEGRFGLGEKKHWLAGQSFDLLPSLENGDDVYTKLTTYLRYDMSEVWFFKVEHIWDWDNTPAPGNERSDHRVLASLGYTI